MFPSPRVTLAVATLVLSGILSDAHADGSARLPLAGPVPPARPLLLDGFPSADAAVTVATAGSRRSRPSRKSRLAGAEPLTKALAGATPQNFETTGTGAGPATGTPRGSPTEPASATPAETVMARGEGPHETAAPTLGDLVARHAIENGVPVSLARAVVRIESRGNPRASNGGALGLMQIKPGTARAAGFNGGASGLFVADTNLHFGMKILGQAFRSSGGDVCRALMLYQSGHLATRMTRSNRIYCEKARAVMAGV